MRFTSLTATVVLTPFTGNAQTGESTKSWIDPIVGARVKAPTGKGWSIEGYGDVGGFGIGSDLTWCLTGRVNWQVSRSIGIGAGYRVLYQDYETGAARTCSAGRSRRRGRSWPPTSRSEERNESVTRVREVKVSFVE